MKALPSRVPSANCPNGGFGKTNPWARSVRGSPLFYIDDEEASVVAKYADSDRVSAAIAFLEEGWTSVYIAEPALSSSLLREILQIFEKHVYVRMTPAGLNDTIHFGSDLIAIHAQGAGERLIELTQTSDVTDLLDPRCRMAEEAHLQVTSRARTDAPSQVEGRRIGDALPPR